MLQPFLVTSLSASPQGPPTHLHWACSARLNEISRPGFCAPAQHVLISSPAPSRHWQQLLFLTPEVPLNAQYLLILVGFLPQSLTWEMFFSFLKLFKNAFTKKKTLFNHGSDFFFFIQIKQIQLPQLFFLRTISKILIIDTHFLQISSQPRIHASSIHQEPSPVSPVMGMVWELVKYTDSPQAPSWDSLSELGVGLGREPGLSQVQRLLWLQVWGQPEPLLRLSRGIYLTEFSSLTKCC